MSRWTPELVEAVVLYLERPRDVKLVLASLPQSLLTLSLQCVAQLTAMAVVHWPEVYLDETAINARSLRLLAAARRLGPSIAVHVTAGDRFQALTRLLAGCITRVDIKSALILPAGLRLQAALGSCRALRHLSLFIPSKSDAVVWLKPLLQHLATTKTLTTLDLRFGRDSIQSYVFEHVAHWLCQPSASFLVCRGDVTAEEALWSALGASAVLTDLVLESPRLLTRPTTDYRLPDTLRTLTWKASNERSMGPVAAMLRSVSRLSSLTLSWGHLPPSPLVAVVRDLRHLVAVAFTGNRLGCNVFPPVLQAIANLQLLETLSLSDNQLTDSVVPYLLHILTTCTALRMLDVAQNAMSATGLARLLPLLATKPKLARVQLEDNRYVLRDLTHVASSLAHWPSASTLVLGFDSSHGADALLFLEKIQTTTPIRVEMRDSEWYVPRLLQRAYTRETTRLRNGNDQQPWTLRLVSYARKE
ncbi:hypothetical protein SDRG_04550 [Saprolegnia diclina VS20]|uniref:F-box domain-containing protein n=1 Tax=Saprolegnia diclina (strain VS20) TaxID=1156394 RepID=T0QVR6_SAPDV|nr:hypothetical protein SDRG_04550 [Saprolegnia diclina VS20]EQC38120.1 hypothetical protein SDRG_04550 [Saprolegnia diclina VS20]|eukprot:XP_008608447.1 hypothetical protein SDRG_04550 [Saprolegnia diclina VS20]